MMKEHFGIVVIGRNEGERLQQCLQSSKKETDNIVYVDSGSSDQSVSFSKSQGIRVVELDMSIPFSAARARNAGFDILDKENQGLEFVQFIDGDCYFAEEWIKTGLDFLLENSGYAIVAGRRRELFPDATIYNRLCDVEWNTPVGDTKACGGDFIIRCDAFKSVNGFNPSVVAGEEPDLCYRLGKQEWKIYRINHDMTFHDANINSLNQWCRRSIRTGHAYLQGFLLHKKDRNGYYQTEVIKGWMWGCFYPIVVITTGLLFHPLVFLLLCIYIMRFFRIALNMNQRLHSLRVSMFYSIFTIIGGFTEVFGQIKYLLKVIQKKAPQIVEYK